MYKGRNYRAVLTSICALVSVTGLMLASTNKTPTKLIYNASESAPIGFYWLDQKQVGYGDYVAVSVPEAVRMLAYRRGYLPPDVPLIKHVVGITGDKICRQNEQVFINGKPVSVALKQDSQGRRLPRWQGCFTLSKRQVFLLQDHPQSFDGRYFGVVERSQIIGRATKLWFPWQKYDPQ